MKLCVGEEIFCNPEYEAMSRAAANFALENFDAEVHYDRLMDIYNRAMNDK